MNIKNYYFKRTSYICNSCNFVSYSDMEIEEHIRNNHIDVLESDLTNDTKSET